MFKLKRFLNNYKKQLFLGPFFKLIEAILEIMVPPIMALIIDRGVGESDVSYIYKTGLLLVLLGVSGFFCASICQYYASFASQGSGTELRSALFEHILSLSQTEYDKSGKQKFNLSVTSDTYALQLAVAMLIRLVIRVPFIVIGSVAAAFFIDYKLAFVMLFSIPVISLILYFVMKCVVPYYKNLRSSLDRLALIIRESILGMRTIRAFGNEKTEIKRFSVSSDEQANIAVVASRLSGVLNPLIYVTINLFIVTVIYLGSFHIKTGRVTQGELIALVNYMMQIIYALVVAANLAVIFTRASASAARINEIFSKHSSITEPIDEEIFEDENSPAIEFKNITFSYREASPVLSDISFSIPRGKTLGIIGGTGSGKSTITALAMKFYDNYKGQIFLGGCDIKKYKSSSLYKKISYVPQKSMILSVSIEENLRMGNNLIPIEKLKEAVYNSCAEFIFEKEGLDTHCEPDGNNFSGGQKQRLCIARALAANPEILIMDDSFSALDAQTADRILFNLEKQYNFTKIIISQRISIVSKSDIILVLDEGEAVGYGTHSELLANCSVYREINKISQ